MARKKHETFQDVMEANETRPITNVNGTPVVTFEEQRDMAQDIVDSQIDIGIRDYNMRGTLNRTLYYNAAINKSVFYDNRYRVKDGDMEIVIAQTTDGYRAITEQATGRIFQKQVPVYVFRRVGDILTFVKMGIVSDTEFVADFTGKLSEDAMKQILPLIPLENEVTTDTLPI